jgi:glycosyltransferase involved in cell wall biosynthesis
MKIGIFVDELFTGGFQRVAFEESMSFKQNKYDVEMVVLRRTKDNSASEYISEMTAKGIKVKYVSDYIPKILNFSFRFPLFAFFSFFHLSYIFLIWIYFNEKYDFIIVHGTYTSLSCIPYAKKNSIKIANFIHDPIEYIFEQKYRSNIITIVIFKILSIFAHFLDKYLINNSNLVIVYPEIEKYLKKKHNIKANYLPIYNGVKIPNKFYKKSTFAIAATKWDQGKNYIFLIKLWSKYNINIDLIIVGRWANQNEKDEFSNKIKTLRLDKKIKLLGQVSNLNLNKLYSKALFLIHPCKEAFGMTILEAAANKTTSILTNNSGVSNIMNIKSCIMVSENSEVEYINAIQSLIENNKLAISMGIEAFKIAKKYSWKKHNELILKNIE